MSESTIIPSPIPGSATPGEKQVYRLLKQQLSATGVAYFELKLKLRGDTRYPDFIIMSPDEGIIVLEVKDWRIKDVTKVVNTLFIFRSGPYVKHDPFEQARNHVIQVSNILEASNHPQLIHKSGRHAGTLRFPYRHAVILTGISRRDIENHAGLDEAIKDNPVLFRDDLDDHFVQRVFNLPKRFPGQFTQKQIAAARGVLFPEVRIETRPEAVLDINQEGIIKNHLSEEAERALGEPLARLVRGPAGSGKSLVLIRRAIIEAINNPNWRVLVLTYNRQLVRYLRFLAEFQVDNFTDLNNIEITTFHAYCRSVLKSAYLWPNEIIQSGKKDLLIEGVMNDVLPSSDLFTSEFLAEEIRWMKENEVLDWDDYKDVERKGRGRRLSAGQRGHVYNVFSSYQQLIGSRCDWEDIPIRVLTGMNEGTIAQGTYDAVFVDEAQDFAPSWFHVIRQLVNSNTSYLYLTADSAQQIYHSGFSWRNLGINVQGKGRSVMLSERYRNPPAIQYLAYDLIRNDPELQKELKADGEEFLHPNIDLEKKDFNAVTFNLSHSRQSEYDFIASEIGNLRDEGYSFSDVVILHRHRMTIGELQKNLQARDIPVKSSTGQDINFSTNDVWISTLHGVKGLEFKIVFICCFDTLDYGLRHAPGIGEEREQWLLQWQHDQRKILYVGMTRATERLYLTGTDRLPVFVSDIRTTLQSWNDSE